MGALCRNFNSGHFLCLLLGGALLTYFQKWSVVIEFTDWFLISVLAIIANHSLPTIPIISSGVLYSTVTAVITSVLTSFGLVWYFRIRNFERPLYKHLEGPNLFSYGVATKHFAKTLKNAGCKGLYLHPSIQLPTIYELPNFLIWGMQGSGKSNLIKYLVDQLIKRKEQLVLYDIKGEYTEIFLNAQAILFSPKDKRSVYWDLSLDITDYGLAEMFAESVISSTSTKESFWVDSARLVLKGVVSGLIQQKQQWSWPELAEKLFTCDTELSAYLTKYSPEAATLIISGDKTTASIRSMIATQLSWISSIKNNEVIAGSGFSINEWLQQEDQKTLIVQGDLNSPIMSKALVTALISVLTNYVLSRSDDQANSIWLVVDELATINKTNSFEQWLELGRSRGCRTVAGIQMLSQLNSIYGKDDANTILGLFGNIVTFRLGSNGEAKDVASNAFGRRRIEYRTESVNSQGERSYSLPQEYIPVVPPEDIVSLPQPSLKKGVEGYLQIGGVKAAYRLNWPINTSLKKITEAVVKPTSNAEVRVANRLNRR